LDQECSLGVQESKTSLLKATEAEYVVAIVAKNQAICIRKILADLHMDQPKPIQIYVDNQAAISIANNLVFHGRTKHFKIKLYFLKKV
jgi:hypothetical protein